ncbi:CRISPR-associated protein Cas2 [Photobacterium marinum]|uniref:CRISPR-associated endoribonuclease Cas2 n=1 Tax=Photobacterium marinum TaxID=1056511 RepID=L8J8L7_9GAMM|nr:CRISPR-associated endonuclease Cas2 [Photobacterium marinum]ELR63894.1 CRISPR-associated protein Cas2 [Photobacterium marinum]
MALIYVVCFDIEDDKLRRQVGDELLGYGERVQYSVFEIKLSNSSTLKKLKAELKALAEHYEGSVDIRFYYLNEITLEKSTTLDNKPVARFPSAIIL